MICDSTYQIEERSAMTQLTVCTDMVANALVSIRKEMLAVHSLGDASASCWRIKGLALLRSKRADTNLLR
jgi:hypothetical protein